MPSAQVSLPVEIRTNQDDLVASEHYAKLEIQSVIAPDTHWDRSEGWITVAGAWLVLFSTFGYAYSFGVYQDYYTRISLTSRSPSSIAWIGSLQLMMPFACGLLSGKLFDAGYFHATMVTGSVIFTFSLFMLSLTKEDQYYQVFLSQGLGMGIGLGLTFVPTTSVTVRHFKRRRALASGVALSGSSAGALVFPIMLNRLLPTIGFAQSVRATGYIVLGTLSIGNCLMRMPSRRPSEKLPPPNIRAFFRDAAYVWTMLGALLMFFGLLFPVVFIQLYAVEHNIDSGLAFYSLAILNAASFIGRILGNFMADMYGPWNLIVPCTVSTGAMIWAVLGVHGAATLVVVSVLYGLFSGAWFSLALVVLTGFAETPGEVGARTGLVLGFASLGSLFSGPIQGALLSRSFVWIRPVSFSGSLVFVAACFLSSTRYLLTKKRNTQRL